MAKKHPPIIEINGKRYDAITGQPVHHASGTISRPIDDVVRITHPAMRQHAAKPATTHHAKPIVKSVTPPVNVSKPKTAAARGTHHTKAHQPQHGQTLMRQAVSRPTPGLKRHTKAVTRTDILAKSPQLQVVPKWSFTMVDPGRLQRAERVVKSRLISRFATSQPETSLYSYSNLQPQSVVTRPAAAVVTAPTAIHSQAAPSTHNRSMDIFQRALRHANAHEQPPVAPIKRRHAPKTSQTSAQTDTATRKPRHYRRTITLVTSALAVVLLAGFIAYQNKANLTLRVASASAGIHASLPGYKPSGYAVGKFSYSAGKVAINFQNSSTNKSYSLTQKSSNWDSQTLLDSYVANQDHAYQTLESGGRTIYIYGNNNASWVNNGIWYQVTSNGNLSTNDVLHIANSI